MCNLHVTKAKCKPLLSDVRTGARSLVGEKQPAEVARSRLARNTRPLLTAESGVRGETRFLGQLRQSLRSGSARMPLSTRESERVRFRCRQVRIQPPALPASGGFFSAVLKGSLPTFLSRAPLEHNICLSSNLKMPYWKGFSLPLFSSLNADV